MIYFMREQGGEGAVKIGWAIEPTARLSSLQTGNPRRLFLMGTMPGDRDFEGELHEEFGDYRLVGEWFRADEELLERVYGLILSRGFPVTVRDELTRRSDCRYGLPGVTVAVRGQEDGWFYKIDHSKWGPSDDLLLDLYPTPGPEPIDATRRALMMQRAGIPLPEGVSVIRGAVVLMTLAALMRPDMETEWPHGSLHGIPATDCFLMSDWPIVCPCWLGEGECREWEQEGLLS